MYCGYVRANANAILRDTDWIIIREADNGKPADPALKQWRARHPPSKRPEKRCHRSHHRHR
jgi:hypothetical protein